MRPGTGNWRVTSASVCGVGHVRGGKPNQDSHGWAIADDGSVLAIVVADGAGSASLAEVGAQVAAHAALVSLASGASADPEGWTQCLQSALQAALNAVEAESASREVQSRDLATTLILALAGPSGVAAAQIGDGAVVVGDGPGGLVSLTAPRSGEYIKKKSR